jgi:hypothetical protein
MTTPSTTGAPADVSQHPYRSLTATEIAQLKAQHCCGDFSGIEVADDFGATLIRDVVFAGRVRIGRGVRIANVRVKLANYDIADNAVIEDVGTFETNPGATFGNGVEIETLNEGGGRELILFNELSSQFAYMTCVHRYRPKLIERLNAMAQAAAESVKADIGRIGVGATIRSVKKIVDVNVGDHAVVDSADALVNGTILSREDAPTTVGAAVQAEDFIIAEGTKVTGGAIVAKSYIGQGCQIGKQYSVEGSVFFANCEGFHGEACSVFAGPYTVTHHKSSLIIAGMFSFYNAGSGTNQSNHMYKLGPVHEGKLERGCKTGSFSYMMWPCRVGPFSVVLGKHTRNFDTAAFPFSLIEASSEGRCAMVPGLNLSTVGTVRDGDKWPNRDRRKGELKRDRIDFDVFSPLTVGRMITASATLKQLQDATDRAVDTVTVGGAEIKRVLLRSGQKFYRAGIVPYLLEKVVARVEQGKPLATSGGAVYSDRWVDIGGQMMPAARLDALSKSVESGDIADLAALNAAFDAIHAAYAEDEWAFVREAVRQVFDVDLDTADAAQLSDLADQLQQARGKFLKLILVDASKEFGDGSNLGFGHDGEPADIEADFLAVRGDYDSNKFIRQMREQVEELGKRIEAFKQKIA